MKHNLSISQTAMEDLKNSLDPDVFNALYKKLVDQKSRSYISQNLQDNKSLEMKTPSTVNTTLKSRGSAISKSKRPDSRSRNKNIALISNRGFQNTVTKQLFQNNMQKQQPSKSALDSEIFANNQRKVITDRAIYYGKVQLPYLHSSDAISSLYQRSKPNDKQSLQPLINPPSSISPSILTNVKNLYLYYTSLDSLRQLGTGWSNLKSLTVMCSYQLKDLSGLSIFPSLQYLFVPHNNICEISDLMYHSTLRCIDLQDNKLNLFDQVQYLYTISNLEWVDISGNPITLIKQKYRIIVENLGNKMQIEEHNKVFQYQIMQMDLDSQLFSYDNIQTSNHLIKEINEQILKQQVKIGESWRAAYENLNNGDSQDLIQPDIQIIKAFEVFDQQQFQKSQSQKLNDSLQLRVTPLTKYVDKNINLMPLKKYFLNKICPQLRNQKQKQKNNKEKNSPEESNHQILESKTKKFSATQKLTSAVSQQKQKVRLNSVSLKKRLGRLSVSKNTNFLSTASSALTSVKPKQQILGQLNTLTSSTGLKFITKRKLLTKNSEQILLKF